MRRASFVLILVSILSLGYLSVVSALPTFYGGSFDRGLWPRVVDTNVRLFESGADFFHYPWMAEDVHQLADQDIKIIFRIFWWWPFYNGQIAWNTSVVDFYYNASVLKLLEQEIDWQLSHLNMSKIWGVTLSDEEPGYAYQYFWTPASLQKYNETYHSETGFWLRGRYDLNQTEEFVLNDWLTEKFVGVFNHVYDYIKSEWPHLRVFQFTWLWPGAPPVWVGGINLGDLNADAYMTDLYFYDAYDNPFWLYEFVRQTRSTFPDRDYYFYLWGEEAWPEAGLSGGFEHIRRNAFVAYLAGVDAVGWFNWHYIHGNIWERDDPLGKRLLVYTNRLNEELAKLPRFTPKPQVLVIRDQMMSFQVGLCADLGFLNEWDAVGQNVFAKKDLSQYRLIIANEDRYREEVVEKLNEYVKSGGNLILLGGFGWEQRNIYDNATRTSKFLIEEGVRQEHIWGDMSINISEPNLLGLDLQFRLLKSSMLAIAKDTLTENHHAIGEFYAIDESGNPSPIEYCPLVLYHNSSNPGEGSILYWGVPSGPGPTHGIPDPQYEDAVEAFLPEYNYTRFLYRTVSTAFAKNYLHLNGSVATSQTENMIMTQSKIDNGIILAGVSNCHPHPVNINYTLDLDRFDLPEGEYFVHSLDENLTLGWFESQQSLLEVPLSVVENGTRLLLISRDRLDPSYSVNIFPDIPTAEEVEDLWLIKPSASFTYSPTDPSIDDRIDFLDNSTDPDGTIVSWHWEFGDGDSSTEQNPTHKYADKGQHTVVLTVTDNDGGTHPSELTISVRNLPPTASFTYSPSSPTAGEEVSFIDASSDPEGRRITCSWDFGDGFTATEENPTHRYENPASYTATLTIKDDEGLEGTYSTTIDVEPEQIEPDHTIYFVIGGLVVVAVLALTVIVRRRKLS